MTTAAARNGALMTVASMMSVQLGAALAVKLMDGIGPAGVAWLRLAWAGVLMLLFVRPRPASFTRSAFLSCVLLGITTAGFTLLFMVAVSRIPLGTASALECLGPLAVAVAKGRGRGRLLFPAMAGTGVVLLTQPWAAAVDLIGVSAALASAVCLGAYILLTQRVGDAVTGITGLAVSMPVAGLVVTMVAGPSVIGHLTPHLLLAGLGLAILLPAIPFTLEMLALRRLTAAAFGTLMSLEPAFAMMLGLLILHQVPGLPALAGIALVVLAGVGAARSGARPAAGAGHREPALVVE
ncbi:putative permease, DMT superfamily [Mycobacteroides abscessus subsp. abscessus]|nr:putative permease, DMT superfamily [Mycobacteroides abscessus subsp. abscessus]